MPNPVVDRGALMQCEICGKEIGEAEPSSAITKGTDMARVYPVHTECFKEAYPEFYEMLREIGDHGSKTGTD